MPANIDLYTAVRDILGAQCAIVPIGDPLHENVARTTVTTVGNGSGDGLVFTYSKAVQTFDTSIYRQGLRIPVVTFDEVDEELDTPDIAFFSRDDSMSEAMSVGL